MLRTWAWPGVDQIGSGGAARTICPWPLLNLQHMPTEAVVERNLICCCEGVRMKKDTVWLVWHQVIIVWLLSSLWILDYTVATSPSRHKGALKYLPVANLGACAASALARHCEMDGKRCVERAEKTMQCRAIFRNWCQNLDIKAVGFGYFELLHTKTEFAKVQSVLKELQRLQASSWPWENWETGVVSFLSIHPQDWMV